MRGVRMAALAALMWFTLPLVKAGDPPANAGAGLSFGPAQTSGIQSPELFGKKKHKFLALGVVAGDPIGFGGRIVVQPTRFGVSADLAYNRIRLDTGPMTGAFQMKLDGRFYGKGFLGKLLRLYTFGGGTLTRAEFTDLGMENAWAMDAGVGGGVRIGRLEVNAEAGLLVPVKSPATYEQRFDLFTNVSLLFWVGQYETSKKKKKK